MNPDDQRKKNNRLWNSGDPDEMYYRQRKEDEGEWMND